MIRIAIEGALVGQRIDRVVAARLPRLSRAALRELFADGRVRWAGNGKAAKGARGAEGAVLEIEVADDELADGAAPDEALPLSIAWETRACVIVDKPAGIASAPLRAGERGTIANALVARYPEMAGVGYSAREPGLCHRLDTGTSGLLLAARSIAAFDELRAAISAGALDKRYLLVCPAAELEDSGIIDLPLVTDGRRVRAAAGDAARPALTRYRVMRRHSGLALVEARAPRATRHQIRAHFAEIGAPLLGDRLYGCSTPPLGAPLGERHALHASRIAYGGGAAVDAFDVSSPLPEEIAALVPK